MGLGCEGLSMECDLASLLGSCFEDRHSLRGHVPIADCSWLHWERHGFPPAPCGSTLAGAEKTGPGKPLSDTGADRLVALEIEKRGGCGTITEETLTESAFVTLNAMAAVSWNRSSNKRSPLAGRSHGPGRRDLG